MPTVTYAEWHIKAIFMLSIVRLNVIMLSVVAPKGERCFYWKSLMSAAEQGSSHHFLVGKNSEQCYKTFFTGVSPVAWGLYHKTYYGRNLRFR